MEDYPQVQNTSNSLLPPQETISHAQKNIISPSVNGDQPVHPYYTNPIVPPSSTTTYGYPGEFVPGTANAATGDSSDRTYTSVLEPVPQNDNNENECENEHSPVSHSTQNESSDVSCLLKTAVIVQASLFEQTDPVEDVKPIVGGCIDDIGREDEPQEILALVPDRLLLDETEECREYDALDGIEAAKIDPIVPLEVPILKSTKIIDEIAPPREDVGSEDTTIATKSDNLNKSTAHSDMDEYPTGQEFSESEEEEAFEPDCGEMIGLSTDDEIELRQRMCANSVRRCKPSKKRSSESRSEEDVSIVKKERKDVISTKYEFDESSNLPIPQQSRHRKKRRKIHTIRIVDVKKELLKIDDQYSEESIDKSEQVSSSNNGSNDSGSGLSCEEIVSDDNLRDIRDTKSKRRRSRNDASARVNSRAAKKVEEIAGLKLPAHQQQQLQTMVLKRKQTTRDRFYDRSQDIPNEIYFENMDVPLHILHDTSSSSSDEEPAVVSKHRKTSDYYSSSRNRPSSSYTGRYETGAHHSLQSMKMFLKTAGFRHMRYQKLWEGCHTTHERAEAILRFLQDNGLQGEPTVEKCRELRKQIQLENEAKVLDVSVIINAGEGRVTRQRTKMLTTTTAPSNSEQQNKVVETRQREAPQASESNIEEASPQGNNEIQDKEIEHQKEGQQSTLQLENESTECHNEQDIGQKEGVQESNVQTGIEEAECHSEENIEKDQQQKVPDGEVPPVYEPTESHSEQNTEIGQQLTNEEKSSQPSNDLIGSHNDQDIEKEQEKADQMPLQFADEQIKSHAIEQTTQEIEPQSGNEPSECHKEPKRASENQQKNQSGGSSPCHDEKTCISLEQATSTEETAAVVSHNGLDTSGQVKG
ncbi:uncharacterized protein LOC131284488 [Anopheles ziemanni]|uniref:uncharacterized protein LOC131284488 n=1 Tax=Anopheles ziemanni TaxID=345580 RepID=UPI00265EE499|nr:uncharacterized protein LOC131284488 [Anopheles ziemanni]